MFPASPAGAPELPRRNSRLVVPEEKPELEEEGDHRGDPDDNRWREQEPSQPANRSIEIPTRAAWEEPKFLDKAGNVINELPEEAQADNGPHRYRNE